MSVGDQAVTESEIDSGKSQETKTSGFISIRMRHVVGAFP